VVENKKYVEIYKRIDSYPDAEYGDLHGYIKWTP